jgi:hypothetical protein
MPVTDNWDRLTSPEAAPRTAREMVKHGLMRSGCREAYAEELILAIEAEAAAGTALDVERLYLALYKVELPNSTSAIREEYRRQKAASIAREYARLAGEDSK